jgi:hypothetical protein
MLSLINVAYIVQCFDASSDRQSLTVFPTCDERIFDNGSLFSINRALMTTNIARSDGRSERGLRIPVPRDSRGLFRLLALYEPSMGLTSLLDQLDFSGVTPAQIYHAALRRAPELIKQAARGPGYNPKGHWQRALLSDEFQKRVIENFLNAFPEKKRLIFIHIPKCAGTDLAFHLAPRYLSLPSILAHEVWSPKDKLLNTLSQLTRLTNYLDEILIYGHIELPIYLKSAGYRPDDRIFTVLRNPVGLVVSQANYVVSRIVADPEGNLPDAREWLGLLGLQKLPANPTDGYLKELAVRALYHPQLTQPNRICAHLSKGPNRDGASAIRHIVTHNIEVTDTENYNDWLKERWNVASITRHNQSTKFLDQKKSSLSTATRSTD